MGTIKSKGPAVWVMLAIVLACVVYLIVIVSVDIFQNGAEEQGSEPAVELQSSQ